MSVKAALIEIHHVPADSLVPATYNPRHMPEAEMASLMRSLETFGFVDPILVKRDDRTVIGGHQRLAAATRLGMTTVPIVELDVSDDEARALNIALNKIGGEWDVPKLAELLRELPEGLAALTGFDDKEMQRVAREAEAAIRAMQDEQDLDAVPELPDEATTEPGDLWLLGDHRLLCGDSGSADDLDKLLGGEPVHLVHTDPPYGVAVEPRSAAAIRAGRSSFSGGKHAASAPKLKPKDRRLVNDELVGEKYTAVLDTWFANIARVLLPGRAFYLWGGYANCANYPQALERSGLYFSQSIIWVKGHPVLGRKDFMGNHEWCFYGWCKGAAHSFYGPNNVADVWEVKKLHHTKTVHLTEKPVELAIRAIEYSSSPGENVLDLFGGSGSTLIGCEQTERRGFLMELDTLYCDVIVARWEQLTGRTATRE